MTEADNKYKPPSETPDLNRQKAADQFSARDCIESMARRFGYNVISTSSDNSLFTIARPEVFTFTPEENRIFTEEIYNFLLEYYARKNYGLRKNSPKKRFELWKDEKLEACIGLHHDERNSTIWWYDKIND